MDLSRGKQNVSTPPRFVRTPAKPFQARPAVNKSMSMRNNNFVASAPTQPAKIHPVYAANKPKTTTHLKIETEKVATPIVAYHAAPKKLAVYDNVAKKPTQNKAKASRRSTSSKPTYAPRIDTLKLQPKNNLRIIPLGGNEEVGRNMTVFEYDGDIVILDMGMMFPEEDMPGIDYIVPNIDYLKGKEKQIRGVVLSHGHLDHIGAAPILLKELGYPVVVARDMTLALVKKKMEDFEQGSAENMKTIRVKSASDKVRLGKLEIEFFEIEHSIMDAVGVVIKTPHGTIIHPGDWTMEKDATGKSLVTYTELAKLPSPRILMLESLGAINTNPSRTTEEEMYANLEKLISEAPGKIIIGMFSSQINRIGHILEYAEKIGKRVALDGYSMKMNVEIAKELGYIKMHKDTLIPVTNIQNYPANKIIVICTGAQGEGNAVLSRIVNGEHRSIQIEKKDTIVFSSSVVPGNERTVQRLKDNLYRKCDNVIHSDILDVHISGHCSSFDIQDMLKQVQPDFFLPVYGNHYMLKEAEKLAIRTGFRNEQVIVLDNGNVLEIEKNKAVLLPGKVDTSYIMVDGLGVGDVGQVVLRDRQMLAEDGMFVITVIIDSKTKKLIGKPQITSRGFIFVKENFDLVNATKKKVEEIVAKKTSPDTSINWDYVKNNIRETVGSYLYTKTQRRPMVLPVVIEV
ncbi:MAG: Beta-lactamase domain protein [Candidatus Moranbacteria bacterium GW2011_GWA2_39_41]|nr:MAG: Beta-lactamase domain protein [Candidatus Moranbacteria bacterium GW2011_GWA2_39_41]